MPLHIRKRIRDAAVVALTGLPTTQTRVYPWRADALSKEQLPALKILTPDIGRGTVVLTIEAIAALDDDGGSVADWLDQIAVEVESAIAADVTLGGVAIDATLNGSSLTIDAEGETTVAVLSLQYVIAADTTGALAAVKAGGVTVGRLRSFTLEEQTAPAPLETAGDLWAQHSEKVVARWTAAIEVRLDRSDPAQAALSLKSRHDLAFYPEGLSRAPLSGTGIVAEIEDSAGGDGDTIRTLTIVGSGPLA